MAASSDFDWWGHYDHVCEIAQEPRSAVAPITLDLTGEMDVPDTIDVLSFKVLTGKALILTRFEGYAFNINTPAAAILTPPAQGVFPWTLSIANVASPNFKWVSRTTAGIESIVMPPRPQSCMDQNTLLIFPEDQTAVLIMDDQSSPANSDYGWSFRAWAWLIPAGKVTNFALLQSRFNTNYIP